MNLLYIIKMLDLEKDLFCDIIIYIVFILTLILLILYVLKYYYNYHFIIKRGNKKVVLSNNINKIYENYENIKEEDNNKGENNKKEKYIEKNDGEQIKKRYYLKDNTFLNDYTSNKKDSVKPSILMIDQLLSKDLQRYYRYVYPQPINDEYYIKKGYNDDNYNETNCKYNLHPLEYINDDLSAGLSKEADKIVLNSK